MLLLIGNLHTTANLRAICSSVSNMSKARNVSSNVFDSRTSRGVGPARLMADVMPYVWRPLSAAPPPLQIVNKTKYTNHVNITCIA